MQTDLSKLTATAGKWEAMAVEFKKLEDQYKQDVHGVTVDGSWAGFSAAAANEHFNVTLRELQGAQAEAKAIAALLRDAHTQFVDLRGKVQAARADAIEAGMKVSARGAVFFDTERLSPSSRNAYHHDPSYQESGRAEAAKWEQIIDRAVKAVSDADVGVGIALNAVVVDTDLLDGTANGFNAKAKNDIEKYEADHMAEISTRINSGTATAQDLKEAERSMRDNSGNKIYSQTLLNSLGADGTIKFTNKLNDLAYFDDKGRKKDYLGLQKGLAVTLASATKDPDSKFYKEFRADLKKAGVEKYDLDVTGEKIAFGKGHGQQAVGYQSLVTLMQHGGGYSGQFLKDVAGDIRAAEDKDQGGDPDVWDLRGDFSGKNDGWFANDPLDGILAVMAKDPETATSYLDPGPDGKNDNLDYLLTDRDWEHENTTDWRGNLEITGRDELNEDVRTGLGLALEAGTTGHEPQAPGTELGRHSEAQARIMHDTINILDYGVADGHDAKDAGPANGDNVLKGDDYANMRGPLARAMASYTPDTVDILAGDGPGGRVGKDDALAAGDGSQIQNSRGSILRMMRGVSEDSENFFLLHEADRLYMAEQLATEDLSDPEDLKNRSAKIGEVFGAINAVGGDVDLGERDAKLSAAGDQRVYGYHVVGSLITGVPVVGDIAQRTVDGYWNEWLKGVTGEEGLLARDKISSNNDAAEQALDSFLESSGEANNRTDTNIGASQREARQSYMGGRELAYDALRERK
ncbi:hypothetical protein GTW37_26005 [Streptomyces sp. SID4931]|nr:hypothetical protein [Streptomyces sp. SID4931]